MAAMNPSRQEGSQFAQLPVELLTRITRWVTTTEYNNVRQSCKLVEQKLFASWSNEFFKKRNFMVSTFSLNTLLAIAKDPRLGLILRHVIISPTRFGDIYPPRWPPRKEDLIVFMLKRYDQDALIQTGSWIHTLADAFRALRNLETIDIRDFESARPRDGPSAKWRPYGLTTAEGWTEHGANEIVTGPVEGSFIDSIFRGVIIAAARSGTNAPNLEIISRRLLLSDGAFYIHPDVKKSVASYLCGLRKLHLAAQDRQPSLAFPNLQAFLHLTPNVTWLRFNMKLDYDNRFLDWLGSPVPNDTDDGDATSPPLSEPYAFCEPPVRLCKLESLDLGLLDASPEQVGTVLKKFPIRSLSLWKICFAKDAIKPFRDGQAAWSTFIASLAHTGVRRLRIGYVVVEEKVPGWGGRRHVLFKGERNENLLQLPNRRYLDDMFNAAAQDVELEPYAENDLPNPGGEGDEDISSIEEDDTDDEDSDDDGSGSDDDGTDSDEDSTDSDGMDES